MGKHCDRCVHVTACLSVFWGVLSGIIYLVLAAMREQILINLGEYNELKREWDTKPFVEMFPVKSTDSCPRSHPVLVAFDEWPGLDVMCSCTSDAAFESVYGEACSGERGETSKCVTKPAVPTLYLPILDGYKICGKRGGKAFKDVTRPEISQSGVLYCPKDTVPCDKDF